MPCPYPATIKKKKKKKDCVLCLSYFVYSNDFMISKRKKKERKKKRNFYWWWQDSILEIMENETRALPLSYRKQLQPHMLQNMYLYSIWRLGPYDLRPLQSHNSNFDLKNLIKCGIKCIYKVVNVSKSQYYEFRHNIMNLGNQNSKYSWRIRDL